MTGKRIVLDLQEVLKIYDSVRKPCPKCGKLMTPLGDPPDDPYLYCWDCKVSVPMEPASKENKGASNQ